MIDLPSRFWSSRNGTIKYVVLHTTQGNDSRTWLTQTGNVSAHYLVRGTTVYRLVDEDNVAWHAGLVVGDPITDLYDPNENPNEASIGIEMEGFAASRLSDDLVRTTAELIKDIWQRRGPLPLVAHAHLSPGNRSDPGVENFSRVVDAARGTDMDLAELERRIDAKLAEYGARLQPELEIDRRRIDSIEKRLQAAGAALDLQ